MFQANFKPNKEQQTEAISLPSKHKLEASSPQAKTKFYADLSRTKCGVLTFNWISFKAKWGFIRADHELN